MNHNQQTPSVTKKTSGAPLRTYPAVFPNGAPTGVLASNARNQKRLTAKVAAKLWAKFNLKLQRQKGLR